MKTNIISVLAVFILVWFLFDPYGRIIGNRNIENCMSLKSGDLKESVVELMGEPSSEHQEGKLLQYFPTRPASSCQVVIEFEVIEGKSVLSSKFCDDGDVYPCRS